MFENITVLLSLPLLGLPEKEQDTIFHQGITLFDYCSVLIYSPMDSDVLSSYIKAFF
jgi:hypothetical protein